MIRQLLDNVALLNQGGDPQRATSILERLDIPLLLPQQPSPPFLLELTDDRLSIRQTDKHGYASVSVDFVAGKAAHRRGQGELIARAVGVPKLLPLTVVDATAGLGRDAFVLASKGCDVILIERHPVIFTLLEDGLNRALSDPSTREIAKRMTLLNMDAELWLSTVAQPPEIIYLDPMFPASKKSAAVKKEMQLFQDLLGHQPESPSLLEVARSVAKRRTVVKRPLKSTPLQQQNPNHSVKGRSTRFDVYLGGSPFSGRLLVSN